MSDSVKRVTVADVVAHHVQLDMQAGVVEIYGPPKSLKDAADHRFIEQLGKTFQAMRRNEIALEMLAAPPGQRNGIR